ncbi:hypothetical protein N2152v2_008669 [Parachlorella kessleri]
MSRRGGRGGAQQSAPSWADVDALLEMATKALNARTKAAQELEARLAKTSLRLQKEIQEKGQARRSLARKRCLLVARLEASAAEDSSFLSGQVQALMGEKAALQARLTAAERERDSLRQEVQLLRGLLEAHATDDSLPHTPDSSARILRQELAWERQHAAELEQEAAELRARVAALERAGQAQHAALLSCLHPTEVDPHSCVSGHEDVVGDKEDSLEQQQGTPPMGERPVGQGSAVYSGLFEE